MANVAMQTTAGPESYQENDGGHRGSRAVRRLVEYAPASGGLALWMRHRNVELPPGPGRHRLATHERDTWLIGNDGVTLWYGPAFEHRSLEEQTGLVAHQVLHVALRHVPREQELSRVLGAIDPALFNLCADAIVDSALSHLEWLSLPADAVLLDTLLERLLGETESPGAALLRWDTESLYRAVDDRSQGHSASARQSQQRSGSQGDDKADSALSSQAAGQGTGDADGLAGGDAGRDTDAASCDPTEVPTESISHQSSDGPRAEAARQLNAGRTADLFPNADESLEDETSLAHTWRERLTRAHASDAEQSILRELLADRASVKTPWEPLLRTRMRRALAQQPSLSWSRPTRSWLANRGRTANGRRLPWQPGQSGTRPAPRLCVILDVSGSISEDALGRFARELERLIRVYRAEIQVIAGDDRVRYQGRLRPGGAPLSGLVTKGGGGTNLIPLLEAAAEHRPDLAIVLTDLEGPVGLAPGFEIIWAVPASAGYQPAPYGTLIVLHE